MNIKFKLNTKLKDVVYCDAPSYLVGKNVKKQQFRLTKHQKELRKLFVKMLEFSIIEGKKHGWKVDAEKVIEASREYIQEKGL